MDDMMIKTVQAADLRPKWRVKIKTMARRKPVNGIVLGYVKDLVFYSNWIKDGWINISANRWVVVSACELVDEPPIIDPPVFGNLYQLLGDVDLPPQYRKKERSNVPQTVRFHHDGGGNIRYTDELIAFMMALNPGMTRDNFEKTCDTYNRFPGEKFYLGNRKYPFEIGFAQIHTWSSAALCGVVGWAFLLG